MNDIVGPARAQIQLARLATVDVIGGTRLGDALEGHTTIDLDGLRELLIRRTP
jgi:hypothetical protein